MPLNQRAKGTMHYQRALLVRQFGELLAAMPLPIRLLAHYYARISGLRPR